MTGFFYVSDSAEGEKNSSAVSVKYFMAGVPISACDKK